MKPIGAFKVTLLACLALATPGAGARSQSLNAPSKTELDARAARLIAAYPNQLDRLEGAMLVFKDGTRIVFDDALRAKSYDDLLTHPDVKDQLALAYPAGAPAAPPAVNFDPGRFRNAAFFMHIYGDCSRQQVAPYLVAVEWLPKKKGGTVRVTSINGVADRLRSVSAELDALPARFDRFLLSPAGGYNCRTVAGTRQTSAHSYGIAVDINARHADYWQWNASGRGATIPYKSAVPAEIVSIFERHGFIWGGRWYHYDTMHFEYRPELLAP